LLPVVPIKKGISDSLIPFFIGVALAVHDELGEQDWGISTKILMHAHFVLDFDNSKSRRLYYLMLECKSYSE
jgi:hypothetical protein